MVITLWAALGVWDTFSGQILSSEYRLSEALPFVDWYWWLIGLLVLFMVILFESAFSLASHSTSNPVVARLRSESFASKDGRIFTGLDILLAIATDLAIGIRDTSIGIKLSKRLGAAFPVGTLQAIKSELLISGAADRKYVEPSRADASGRYASIHAIPYDLYYLSAEGAEAVNLIREGLDQTESVVLAAR